MYDRYLLARIKAKALQLIKKAPEKKIEVVAEIKTEEPVKEKNPQSKNVYAFVGKKCVGIYDSITLCATTLGLSRAMVKKAIESGATLDNGFTLKLTNK